jgi:hypothetical protein
VPVSPRFALAALAALLLATPAALAQESPGAPAPAASDVYRLPPPPPPLRRDGPRVAGALEGGYTLQNLYGFAINGAAFEGNVVADFGSWSFGGMLDVVEARTDLGLGSFAIRAGPIVEARSGRLRLGGGFRVGGLDIRRATNDSVMYAASLGVFVRVSVDLFQFEEEGRGAIYLVGKGALDDVGGALSGASLGVGVRF